jgi:mRNA-degrading endonuclease toxin of MazEF toxin-antitoxin module
MHILTNPPEGGLTSQSVVMCDQLRTVSLDRLNYRRGAVGGATLVEVRTVIQLVFDI